MNINKPMAYDEFQKITKEMQIKYLQNLIDNYNGNLSTIADMFGITKPTLCYYIKKNLDNSVKARHGGWTPKPNKQWLAFLGENTDMKEIVEPIEESEKQEIAIQNEPGVQEKDTEEWMSHPIRSFKAFRMRNKYQQEQYLNWLVHKFDGSIKRIAEMLNIPKSELQKHIGKNGIQVDPQEAENNRKPREKWICFMEGIEYEAAVACPVIMETSDGPVIVDEEASCAQTYVDGSPVMKSARLVFAMHDTSSLKEILDFVKKIGVPLKGTVTFEINV